MIKGLKEVTEMSRDIENGLLDRMDVFYSPPFDAVFGEEASSAEGVRSLCDGDGLIYCGCIERKTSVEELRDMVRAAIREEEAFIEGV